MLMVTYLPGSFWIPEVGALDSPSPALQVTLLQNEHLRPQLTLVRNETAGILCFQHIYTFTGVHTLQKNGWIADSGFTE